MRAIYRTCKRCLGIVLYEDVEFIRDSTIYNVCFKIYTGGRVLKTILFIANNPTALAGMIFLIEKMERKYGSVCPILVCESCYYETDKFCVINLTGNVKEKLGTRKDSIVEFYNRDRKKWTKQFFQFVCTYYKMLLSDKRSKKILEDINPDALVVYCDRMGDILQGFLKNAKNIPIIRVPIGLQSDYRKSFEHRYYDCELILTEKIWDMNRLMLLINKSWIRCINHEYRAFYPLGYTIAGWLRGMISMHPWVSGGGRATHVMVSTSDEKEMILEEVDKTVIVTGAIEDYYILQLKKERQKVAYDVKTKYNIDRKIVVFALPQLAEHNMVSWTIHKKNMEILLQALHKEYGRILISLHPKSDIDNYRYLIKYGTFIDEKMRDIICATDLLITISSSSVLHWAQLLHINKFVIDTHVLLKEISYEQIEKFMNQKTFKIETAEDDVNITNSIKCVVDEIMAIV